MNILFLISNYLTEDFLDRKEMLASTIKDINNANQNYIIFDDESTIDFSDIADPNNIIKHNHRGKQEYWKTWQDMFNYIKEHKYDGYVFIPNDIVNYDFDRTINYLNDFKNNPFVVNVVNDGRTKQWVNKPLVKINNSVSLVSFTDCGFFTNYETIKLLDFKMNEINKIRFNNPNISSGVGEQLSIRLDHLKVPIYLPTNSICKHGNHKSSMHYKERINKPLVSVHKNNIVVGIATMNSRKNSLAKVLQSLNNQTIKPDKIVIYNNDENNFNATDNGKFYYFETEESKNEEVIFFSMDDDIYYPKTYIEDMIKAIEKYNCIVTHHGRILNGLDLHYYRGHKSYACLHDNNYEGPIDVTGTGVTVFSTSYFKPTNIFESEYKRMSDCIFSLEATKQQKDIIILKHKTGYLKDICDDVVNSCHRLESIQPTKQIEVCNEIYKLKKK